MTHGSLFSGIGGFDLAAQWMGWTNEFHCEWNEFGQRVLKHYWPNSVSYGDITKTDFTIWRGRIDVLTGGFPCQPFSTAGSRKGKEDDRYLWPEMLRAIREIQPRWVVAENVYGIINQAKGMVFESVCTDMEAEGYKVQPIVLPACAVGAQIRRDRVWFVGFLPNSSSIRFKSNQKFQKRQQYPARWKTQCFVDPLYSISESKYRRDKSTIIGGINGISNELEQQLEQFGNAIVPQVAFQIFMTIKDYDLRLLQS